MLSLPSRIPARNATEMVINKAVYRAISVPIGVVSGVRPSTLPTLGE